MDTAAGSAGDAAVSLPAEAGSPDIALSPDVEPAAERIEAVLPAYTPVKVMMNQELSTQTHTVGDQFFVTVVEDVVENDTVIVPAGSRGWGEVTFATRKGGFGKPGIVGISLRSLELGDRVVPLDGRYREEGKNKNGAVAATWFAVGVFSGFIQGRAGYIEQGRELRARLGEDITYFIGEDAVLPASAAPITEENAAETAIDPDPTPKSETGEEAEGIVASEL